MMVRIIACSLLQILLAAAVSSVSRRAVHERAVCPRVSEVTAQETVGRAVLPVVSDFGRPVPGAPLNFSLGDYFVQDARRIKGFSRCGDGYCPSVAPICCGDPSYYYCVSGGNKCCTAPGNVVVSCAQSEECCVAEGNATCCKAGSSCVSVGGKTSCVTDSCSVHVTADECRNKGGNCGWCCEERRCISSKGVCPNRKPPVGPGASCPSRCHYADTCGLCLATSNATDHLENCMWCCGTQSCLPGNQVNMCENFQGINSEQHCSACLANGDGVEPVFFGSFQQLLAVFSGLIFVLGIISCAWVSRAYAAYRSNIMTENGLRHGELEAHRAVRRHGFSEKLVSEGTSKECLLKRLCCASRRKSSADDLASAEEDGDRSCLGVELYCAGCKSALHLRSLFVAINVEQGVGSSKESAGNAHVDGPPEDDKVVVLLPCGHFYCYSCLKIRKRRGRRSKPSSTGTCEAGFSASANAAGKGSSEGDNAHLSAGSHGSSYGCGEVRAVAGADEAPAAPQRSRLLGCLSCFFGTRSEKKVRVSPKDAKDFDKFVMKRIKRKCPKCKTSVTDILLPSNILHL